MIPIRCNNPPSNSRESVTADSFSKLLISLAPSASGYITSSIPRDDKSNVSLRCNSSELEIRAIHFFTPNFLPIEHDRILVCCDEVTAINRSAFFAPAISNVLIEVTSPFIVDTSKL